MFFVKNLKTGQIKDFETPGKVEIFLLGKLVSQHEIFFASPVTLTNEEHFHIERALEAVVQEKQGQ